MMNYNIIVTNTVKESQNLPYNDRLTEVFNNVLQIEDGYCVEIGAGYGETTVKLLSYTKNFKVIVVDPFEDGWDNMPESYGKPYPFSLFKNNIKNFSDKLILLKKSSDDLSVIDELKEYKPIVFSFVDGLQFTENVLYDLNMMDSLNCKVICIDDYNRLTNISQVPLAIDEFLKNNKKYDIVYQQGNREVYLVRNEKN